MTTDYGYDQGIEMAMSAIDGRWKTPAEMPVESDISRRMAADMKKRGIGFVGPVITYSFLQSIGIVNDHLADCPWR
jgi:DNA-3-methyladenine glycosylase I